MRVLLDLAYFALWLGLVPSRAWHALCGRPLPAASLGRALGLVPPRQGEHPCLWLHGESLGEMNVLFSLLAPLAPLLAGWDVVITAGTSSGYKMALERAGGRRVLFSPLDLPRSVANFLDRIRPTALVVVESSRQPRLIAAAKARGIPRTLVNGRVLTHRAAPGQLPGHSEREMLRSFNSVIAQTDDDAQSFRECGVASARVSVGGAIKFDNAQFDRRNPATLRLARLAGLGKSDIVWLAGSTRDGEDQIVIRVFAALAREFPRLRLIVVPRHARRFDEVCRLLDQHGVPHQRRTALDRQPADAAARALVVDLFGELPAWWGAAHIGFVGNSLTQRGGQNMIEPAAYGVATCFGPHTENFADVVALLLREDGAAVVDGEQSLRSFVRRCLEQPELAGQLGRRGQQAVAGQSGALARTITHLERFLAAIARPDCRALAVATRRTEHRLRAAS